MANVNTIERQKKEIIKNFAPEEFEAYLKSLVSLYYESYLEQNKEKHSATEKLIEEAVNVYETKYSNVKYNSLVYQVNKANELLTETLIKKSEILTTAEYLIANSYSDKIDKVLHETSILKTVFEAYEKTPSEELASLLKDVLFMAESNLIGVKCTLELNEENFTKEDYPFKEDLQILEEFYSEFLELVKKINSL